MPVAATIRATMPPEGWELPLFKTGSDGYVEEVPNPIWTYHKYLPYSNPAKKVHDQILLYGNPKDLDDFCDKVNRNSSLPPFSSYPLFSCLWHFSYSSCLDIFTFIVSGTTR